MFLDNYLEEVTNAGKQQMVRRFAYLWPFGACSYFHSKNSSDTKRKSTADCEPLPVHVQSQDTYMSRDVAVPSISVQFADANHPKEVEGLQLASLCAWMVSHVVEVNFFVHCLSRLFALCVLLMLLTFSSWAW